MTANLFPVKPSWWAEEFMVHGWYTFISVTIKNIAIFRLKTLPVKNNTFTILKHKTIGLYPILDKKYMPFRGRFEWNDEHNYALG